MTKEEAKKIIKQFRDRQGNSSDDVEAFDMAIKVLEPPRWIPCNERLPKAGEYVGDVCKYYLIQDEYGDMHVAHLSNVGWIPMDSLKAIGNEIIAWQELPQPYKAGKRGINMGYIDKEELIKCMQDDAPMNWTDTDFELGEEAQYKSDREVVESCAEIKVIPIPPRATNGDMIKAMFPNAQIDYHEESDLVDDYVTVFIKGCDTCQDYSYDWWNAPYEGGEE